MKRSAFARAVVFALIGACGVVAYRQGGGSDPRPPLPSVAAAPAASAPAPLPAATPAKSKRRAASADGDEITLRLVDALPEARVIAPNKDRGLQLLGAHWRKMKPPFIAIDGDNKRLATSLALRTSDTEIQWAVPTSSGGTWAPDARVWNMSEGSFDQREALFAPTPCTLTYRVRVPTGGRLTFAPGSANASGEAITFRVTVVDGATTKVVFDERLLPEVTRSWTDRSADLSEFSGKTIELSLVTESSPRSPTDPRPVAAPKRDAGAAEAIAPLGGPALALWGNPTVLSHGATQVPYNVLFVVVDALRPDVIASFHDETEDARKRSARYAPQDALLPRVAGLVPNLDALVARGVRFRHAYSGGAWTRPGTLSMLAGARSSELGLDTLPWVLPEAQTSHFYGSDPPLLPLLLRKRAVATRAFVNNYFMVGYAPVGVDMGFERVDDHRFRTKDTALVTASAIAWLKAHASERFFAFCNYNSPHEPWEPPAQFLARVPPPPDGPRDDIARRYMAEAAKDDEAIGLLLQTLDELGLRDRTLVVVTADHGETLSFDHDGISDLDKMRVRYHHAVSNYEETTRVPIVMSLPGVLPENKAVEARVRNVDIAPTLLEILGLDLPHGTSGRSMMPLVRGQAEVDERVVLSEGRGTRGLIFGHYRLLSREGRAQTTTRGDKRVTATDELYDLDSDPGERHDLARERPEVVKEMRARLEAAKANVPAADAKQQEADAAPSPRVRLRFSGGARPRRISGRLASGDDKAGATMTFELAGLPKEAVRATPGEIQLAFTTSPDEAVGLDLRVEPPSASLHWDLYMDDAPWPKSAVYTGPYGLHDGSADLGLFDDASRASAYALSLPEIDPARDVGLFVIREKKAEAAVAGREANAEGAKEMDRLLKEWGYAHGKTK